MPNHMLERLAAVLLALELDEGLDVGCRNGGKAAVGRNTS